MPKLIIGASHSLNLAQAIGTFEADWQQACTAPIPIEGFDGQQHHLIFLTPKTRFIDFERAGDQLRPVYSDMIHAARRFNRPDVDVLFLVGGNEHNDLCFCEHPVPWDFHLPGVDTLDPSRQVLPLSLIERLLRERLDRVAATLYFLGREFNLARRHCICPPPPIPSSEHIIGHPEVFDFSRQRLAPAHLRLKVYRVYVALLQGICNGLDIRFVPVPAEAQDAEGYLVERHWYGCTHADATYYEPLLASAFEPEKELA
jgi:hypothetical protein